MKNSIATQVFSLFVALLTTGAVLAMASGMYTNLFLTDNAGFMLAKCVESAATKVAKVACQSPRVA